MASDHPRDAREGIGFLVERVKNQPLLVPRRIMRYPSSAEN